MNDNIDHLIQQAVAALKAGRKPEARVFLDRVIELDERNETAWLWMSGAVETDEEQAICLENVLTINPVNQRAAKGLTVLQKKIASQPQNAPQYPVQNAAPRATFSDWASGIGQSSAAPAPAPSPTPSYAAPASQSVPDWWTGPEPSANDSGYGEVFTAGPFGGEAPPAHEEEEWNWEGVDAKGTNPSPFDSGFFRRPSPYMPTSAELTSKPESDPFGLRKKPTAPTNSTKPVRQESNAAASPQRAAVSFPETPISIAPHPAKPAPAAPASPQSKAAPVQPTKADTKPAEAMFDWAALDKNADLPPSQTALFTTVTSKVNSGTLSPALRMASIPEELRRSSLNPILVLSVVLLSILSLLSIGWLIHTLTTH